MSSWGMAIDVDDDEDDGVGCVESSIQRCEPVIDLDALLDDDIEVTVVEGPSPMSMAASSSSKNLHDPKKSALKSVLEHLQAALDRLADQSTSIPLVLTGAKLRSYRNKAKKERQQEIVKRQKLKAQIKVGIGGLGAGVGYSSDCCLSSASSFNWQITPEALERSKILPDTIDSIRRCCIQVWSSVKGCSGGEIIELLDDGSDSNLAQRVVDIIADSCLIPFVIEQLGAQTQVSLETGTEFKALNIALLLLCKTLLEHPCSYRLLGFHIAARRNSAPSRSIADILSSFRENALKLVGTAVKSRATRKRRKVEDQRCAAAKTDDIAVILVDATEALEEARSTGLVIDQVKTLPKVTWQEDDDELELLMVSRSRYDMAPTRAIAYKEAMKPLLFEFVPDFGMHKFFKNNRPFGRCSKKLARRLAQEYADLATSLPASSESWVCMRVLEENMQFAKMMIMGPSPSTPYSNGCFLFDVYFPSDYPAKPPKVLIVTTGGGSVRFNPNLYSCGKVCLSLLGTWEGSKDESWNPQVSTFLQVSISIQALILVDHPYFNEPGYQHSASTASGIQSSKDYNKNIRKSTARWAMLEVLNTLPLTFENVVRTHMKLKGDLIVKQLKEEKWTNMSIISKLEHEINTIGDL